MNCLLGLFAIATFPDIIFSQEHAAPIEVEQQTEEGIVIGKIDHSRYGRDYAAFKGLRYAEKPDRFKLAPKLAKWNGKRNATHDGSPCPQIYPGQGAMLGVFGDEDCLFLNVFTNHHATDKPYPVLVFIHGGAFTIGSTREYLANYFMDEDIVLVTLNYRLGALGFLYNEDDSIPGNLALKDQVEALKWVQRNIHHFGGDAKTVTLFGHSAGAAMAQLHMFSEMSKGLFHRVIAESGSTLSMWAISEYPRWNAERFASALHCPTTPASKMLECLSNVEIDDLIHDQKHEVWGPVNEYSWAPVIEVASAINVSTVFIAKHPKEILAEKKIPSPVPLLMGVTKNEGSLIFSTAILMETELTHDLNTNWSHVSPFLFLDFRNSTITPKHDAITDKIRKFYFGNQPIGLETEQALTDLFSDRYFVHAIHTSVMAHSDIAPTFAYLFTFYDGFSLPHMIHFNNKDPPTHGDDIFFLFNSVIRPHLNTQREKTFSRNMVKLWTTFAANGKPGNLWGSAQSWCPVNRHDCGMSWYQLDEQTELMKDPFYDRVKFWDQLTTDLKMINAS